MKKTITLLLCALLCLGAFCGCTNTAPAQSDGTLHIVTTIFPIYDWTRQIIGENNSRVELTMLMDNGVDLHSYQPTVNDMVRISQCDLFIYVGGESDGWTKDALKSEANRNRETLNLLDALGSAVKEEEQIEGMEAEEEEEEEEEAGPEYDEHVWLSVRNASVLCQSICDALIRIDPENRSVYETNTKAYRAQLDALDAAYSEAVASSSRDTLLFADRFPFRYMVEDYGLHYYAAFLGCSAETEASFETVAFLAAKTDELGLRCIVKLEGSDGELCRTVQQETASGDQEIVVMDSLQSVTSKDLQSGVSYLAVMEKNLEVLKQALE